MTWTVSHAAEYMHVCAFKPMSCWSESSTIRVYCVMHTVYLAISLPPVVFPVRQVLDAWMPGPVDKHPFLRKAFLIFIITVCFHACRAGVSGC
jgi:hypothetical protein